uniref:Minor capsid protein n=2 Tax=Microviridae sp. ctMIi2 TaxID=2824993 RepID=A0A8S5R3I7_9VIRU|nr:MAG TPA: minor capsid protein [Microviridae sp. ctMIi2]
MSAIIAGGSSLLGGILGNSSNAKQAEKNRNFENEQAERQMAFQERMATTEYQRAVADMRAAGINPILAAKLGGNSSPSGASGSGSSAHMENVLAEAGGIPLQMQKMKADLELTREMKNTEVSKQNFNNANASGSFGVPGFLKVPFSSAKNAASSIKKQVFKRDKFSQDAHDNRVRILNQRQNRQPVIPMLAA